MGNSGGRRCRWLRGRRAVEQVESEGQRAFYCLARAVFAFAFVLELSPFGGMWSSLENMSAAGRVFAVSVSVLLLLVVAGPGA